MTDSFEWDEEVIKAAMLEGKVELMRAYDEDAGKRLMEFSEIERPNKTMKRWAYWYARQCAEFGGPLPESVKELLARCLDMKCGEADLYPDIKVTGREEWSRAVLFEASIAVSAEYNPAGPYEVAKHICGGRHAGTDPKQHVTKVQRWQKSKPYRRAVCMQYLATHPEGARKEMLKRLAEH